MYLLPHFLCIYIKVQFKIEGTRWCDRNFNTNFIILIYFTLLLFCFILYGINALILLVPTQVRPFCGYLRLLLIAFQGNQQVVIYPTVNIIKLNCYLCFIKNCNLFSDTVVAHCFLDQQFQGLKLKIIINKIRIKISGKVNSGTLR